MAEEIKIGVIEKISFEEIPHMIVKINHERIWVEGPIESFEKGDYLEGTNIAIKAKEIGTIIGECDFGDIGCLPLFVAESIKII